MSGAGDAELEALRRPFRIGVLAVVAALVAIGGLIAAFGSNADRPDGIAERWLVALSDTTRRGVRDDALERMAEYQITGDPAEVAASLSTFPLDDHGAADDGKARFDTIRVGRGVHAGEDGRSRLVPVQFTPYDSDDVVDGYVLMRDTDDGWKVDAFTPLDAVADADAFADLCPDDRCPGFPIRRPESAPIGFWIGAIVLGVLITIGVSVAIRAAGPPPGRDREAVSGAASSS